MKQLEIALDASFMMTFDDDYTLKYLVMAEEAGFDVLWLGDHFHPWHHSFKHNFYVWSVLPTVLARTKRIRTGVEVTVPIGGRYHPAIIAQASATIDVMFPGRFLLGVGSGEAMSETPFLGYWPKWEERIERLIEAIDLIKKLWASADYFRFDGKYFKLSNIFLYLKPKTQIPIYFSAMGEKSALMAGKYADRLMTVSKLDEFKNIILPKFEEGARTVGRNPAEIEKAVSFGGGIGHAAEIVRRVRKFIAGASIRRMFNEPDPRRIEEAGRNLPDQKIMDDLYICEKAEELIEVFSKFREAGANQIIWGDFSPEPENMMKAFREKIIPYFRE